MSSTWRHVHLDDLRFGSEAYSSVLQPVIRARQEGLVPNTLITFRPKETELNLGVHQDAERDVNMKFCRENGIKVSRRPVAGGLTLIYPGMVWMMLIYEAQTISLLRSPEALFPNFGQMYSRCIREVFGVEATYRPVNDIEVKGRKIAAFGAEFFGRVACIRCYVNIAEPKPIPDDAVPLIPEKVSDKQVKERIRSTSLEAELGSLPDVKMVDGIIPSLCSCLNIGIAEARLTRDELKEGEAFRSKYESHEWINRKSPMIRFSHLPNDAAIREFRVKAPKGLIRAVAASSQGRLLRVILSGDFYISPVTIIDDLESTLADCEVGEVEGKVIGVLCREGVILHGASPRQFADAILGAIGV